MATRRYLNFDLLLEQEGEGRYQARVTDSPLGETPSVRFQLPFDATTLENLLLKLDPGRSGTRRVGGTGQQQAAMDFGGPLYQAVFTGDLALAWQRSLDQVRAEQAGGLRLRLRLNDAPAIAGLPWELLYDARSNNFLAQSERTPLVRFLDVPQVPRPIAVDGPLRVLAIISSPIDLDELDVEAEWARLQEALAPRTSTGLVVLDRLPSATLSELGTWLRRSETHVVHFVGHGDFDPGLREGVIYFQDQAGRRSPVTSSTLGPYLRDHDPLRMVVLNACRSARTDSTDPFGGMAQGLVQQDATAVVAMQFPISDRAAVKFTGEFYGALVDGQPVDQAVSSARKSLLDGFQDEWATPVLFLRSPDGNIFENLHATSGVATTPAEPVPTPTTTTTPTDEQRVALTTLADTMRRTAPRLAAAADGRRRLAVIGAGALALLVVLVVVLINALGGKDAPDDKADDDTPEVTLPSGLPLGSNQVLVAAGADSATMHIFRMDITNSTSMTPLPAAATKEWLPVLNADRTTVIYSRQRPSKTGYVLRVAEARDLGGDRALFDQGPPAPCTKSEGRPAWIAGEDEFVMRCVNNDDQVSLVRVDIHGNLLDTYLTFDEGDDGIQAIGDPTVSRDGHTAVFWASEEWGLQDGLLFKVDLETRTIEELAHPEGSAFSDAAFSGATDMLAWRATVAAEDFEVFAAPFVNGVLEVQETVQISDGEALLDQDPVFSPDGEHIIYGQQSVPTDADTSLVQRILMADVADPTTRHPIGPPSPPFQAVPAWGRR